MDKFAVDLEKVLDEFEFNEGREEAVVPAVIKNSLQHICQKTARPPAASYRRPAFEPINLADADFAAAPSPTPYRSVKQNTYKDSLQNVGENTINSQHLVPSPSKLSNSDTIHNMKENEADINQISELQVNKENQESSEIYSSTSSEDTPDLLDSNILKPVQNNLNNNDDAESMTQLPDITTSIRSTPVLSDSLETTDEPVFDLIKPHTTLMNQSNKIEELPPVVEVGSVIKETIPELHIKPISFDSIGDVPDSELVEYLQSLEVLEANGALDVSSFDDESHLVPSSIPGKSEVEEKTISLSIPAETVNISESLDIEKESQIQSDESQQNHLPINDENHLPSAQTNGEVDLDNFGKVDLNSIDVKPIVETEVQSETIVPSHCVPEPAEITNEVDNVPNECAGEIEGNTENVEPAKIENEEIENSQNEVKAVLNREDAVGENVTEETANAFHDSEATNSSCEHQEMEGGKPPRPNTLALPSHIVTDSEESPTPTSTRAGGIGSMISPEERSLGKVPPFWVPDTEADSCMQCHNKFTVIKRRHHCRACGLVLCSKCCSLKAPLEYMEFQEVRVCQPCFNIIYRVGADEGNFNLGRQPNPNNPMEYCSTIPPLQQAATALLQPPPSVLVPTGVLKREGRAKSDVPKQVIFSDGIRPGGDLTELDVTPESRLPPRRGVRRLATPPGGKSVNSFMRRPLNPTTQSFIPNDTNLPPTVIIEQGHLSFSDEITQVTEQPVKFAINYNLFVSVKKVSLDCCVNRECWSICSEGLACIGQDEIAMVLECLPDENLPPQDVFHLVNTLHQDASKGSTVNEMCFTPAFSTNLLGSKDHGGFLYIRPTLQCTTKLLLPSQPYLFAILVHRWETPWARLFPLRLVLRLGAEYRYYPTPLVSIRNRPPLYTDIGHTIMKLLVDFRKYSYSLATVRGLVIHMEDRLTTILFPKNRYDQVVRALNNSDDSVLAFGANLSLTADSHLVCIQGTQDENSYHTQAINIHNKPRKVTGASFIVFNGALKAAGLSGKSNIMEDGLMVHLPSDSMSALRNALREMQDYTISCGPNDEETVLLKWTDDDMNFNIGVRSCIDGRPMDGIPSIRVHNGTDYPSHSRIIRWTEVFILQCEEGVKGNDPLDISKVSESLARATCVALVPFLDLLAESNLTMLAVRATIHPDNVGYEAGSGGEKLPSQYMKRLDDELVPVVHQAAVTSQDTPAILELIFRVMNHP